MLDIVYYTQSVMCRGYIRHIYDLSSERFGRRRVHVLMVITAALFSLPFAGFNRCRLASDRTNNFCSLSILFFEMNVVAHRCGHVVWSWAQRMVVCILSVSARQRSIVLFWDLRLPLYVCVHLFVYVYEL